MTLNNFLRGVASKLTELWSDRQVFVEKIPRDADGNFFVGIIESNQEAYLDRRRKRNIQFEVLYFLRSDENMIFHDWAEAMYDNFEQLSVEERPEKYRLVTLRNQKARHNNDARVFQFLFDANFHFAHAPDAVPNMNNLDQTEVLK